MKKTERATGCTLDYGNILSLLSLWNNMTHAGLISNLEKQIFDKSCKTYKTLMQYDANMLRLLRTWVQSTKIIGEELNERVVEIQKIIKEHPEEYAAYLKATGLDAATPSQQQSGTNNETH